MYNGKDMKFTWYEEKRQHNSKKRGLDFSQASQVFDEPTFTF